MLLGPYRDSNDPCWGDSASSGQLHYAFCILDWDSYSSIDLLRCSTNGGTAKGNFLLLAGFEDHVLSLGTVCLVSVTGGQKTVPWSWDRKACSLLGAISPKHRLSSREASVTQPGVGSLGPEP